MGIFKDKVHSGAKRVLIVEDDLSLKPILARVLGTMDTEYQYEWCTTAEDAVEWLQEEKFDLVIGDCFLIGKKTGIDLWEHCMEKYPNLPFIMMTSLELEQFFHMTGKDMIIPTLLSKPIRPGECKQIIEGLVQQH